jgi:hypothetical protein
MRILEMVALMSIIQIKAIFDARELLHFLHPCVKVWHLPYCHAVAAEERTFRCRKDREFMFWMSELVGGGIYMYNVLCIYTY